MESDPLERAGVPNAPGAPGRDENPTSGTRGAGDPPGWRRQAAAKPPGAGDGRNRREVVA